MQFSVESMSHTIGIILSTDHFYKSYPFFGGWGVQFSGWKQNCCIQKLLQASKALTVRFGTTLQMIEKLDESSGSLTSYIWLNFEWTDEYLTWNESEHGVILFFRFCQF